MPPKLPRLAAGTICPGETSLLPFDAAASNASPVHHDYVAQLSDGMLIGPSSLTGVRAISLRDAGHRVWKKTLRE